MTLKKSNPVVRTCLLVILSVSMCGLAVADVVHRTIRVDDGQPSPPAAEAGPTHVATIPDTGQSHSIQAFGRATHNLGTFDIVINAGPTLAGNAAALAAFERAAQLWEARISDPMTVIVDADLASLGAGILGSASSELLALSYGGMRNAMITDAANEIDDAIVNALPVTYSATLPAGFGLSGSVFASKANFKALGFDPAQLDAIVGTATDVEITFNTNFNFDFDKSNGITLGQFDFEGIAAHEIGHGLGFFSGVDDVDFILQPGAPNPGNVEFTPLDMFRFEDNVAQDPATVLDFSNVTLQFPRSMVPQHQAVFDQILGGAGGDIEVLMSQGVFFGDGQQASHWKDNGGRGLMDPTAAAGELLNLVANDLRALDLIGYEISIVPEGSAFVLVALGNVLAAGCWTLAAAWRRQSKK